MASHKKDKKDTQDKPPAIRLYVLRCKREVFIVKAHSEADALHIYGASDYSKSFYPVDIVEEIDGVSVNFDL